MNPNQTTRRNFLANMAIVSAGTAFRPFTGILNTTSDPKNLQQQWKLFCKRFGAASISQDLQSLTRIPECKGHWNKEGAAVIFQSENLVAQPTWIYWKENKKDPDDVVVSFYERNGEQKKLFSINRFELEGINSLPENEASLKHLVEVRKNLRSSSVKSQAALGMVIRTSIKNRECTSVVKLKTDNTRIENKIKHYI